MSRNRKSLLVIPLVAIFALALSSCSAAQPSSNSTSTSTSSGKQGDLLTVATNTPPTTLNPVQANPQAGPVWATELAYAPLIQMDPSGSYSPGLATSWKYVGSGNLKFELTLRAGAKFADGSPVDAAAVAASLKYGLKAGGQVAPWGGAISNVQAPTKSTVVISCSTACPVLPRTLNQNALLGDIISPAGLKHPSKLGTETFGAGPYVLDTSQTVANDHYTYLPNKSYWNQSGIHYKKVILRIITNPDTEIQALSTGQVDLIDGIDGSNVSSVSSSDTVYSAPAAFDGLLLADRTGAVAPELKSLKVRQALNYAVDRKSITAALFGKYAQPTTQATGLGQDGYDKSLESAYPYDPSKAKKLLAEAGYPNGFTVSVETQGFAGISLATQAMLSDWAKIGVKTNLTTDPTVATWIASVSTKKYPIVAYGYGGLPMYMQAINWYGTEAGPFNPFGITDPKLTALLEKANNAPAAEQSKLYQAVTAYSVAQAYAVPLSQIDTGYAAGAKIHMPKPTEVNGYPDVATDVTPAG